MEFARSLQQLWRHRYFRRLLAVRIAIQSSDGVLQVALAAYVLFSPERQPDAVSIAVVLAITLLPFSILGPFTAVVIDRVSRRQVLIVANLARAVVALGLAALVATGLQTLGAQALIYTGLLLAMSLNRFLLAALSASLPHTIDPGEYMVANSVIPTVGPAGLLIGVAVATPLRLMLGHVMPDYQANAILFIIATAGFVLSAVMALWIPRRQLGPDEVVATRARDVLSGLVEAVAHLRSQRAAELGLITIAAHRLIQGIVTVAMILAFRNYFHSPDQLDAAITDLGLLVVIGDLPGGAGCDLYPGHADGGGLLAGLDRAGYQDLCRHSGPGTCCGRIQGPGLRDLRHDLQCRARVGGGDCRRDPADQRQISADLDHHGGLLLADRSVVCRGEPWCQHE